MSLPLATSDAISHHILFKTSKFCFVTTQPGQAAGWAAKLLEYAGLAKNFRPAHMSTLDALETLAKVQ